MTAGPSIRPLIISPDVLRGACGSAARVPPGQNVVDHWPVEHEGDVPQIDRASWSLRVVGDCAEPLEVNWDQFMQLPQVDVRCDLHCCGGWSHLDSIFTGVPTRAIAELVHPGDDARFVTLHCERAPHGRWSTTLGQADFIADDCLLAYMCNDKALTPEHGYPARALIPRKFLHRSAKWISEIEFHSDAARATDAAELRDDPWQED